MIQWTVIGAGPAGIAAIGSLLDQGIHPEQILWVDPFFQVGDFGRKWHAVSSNTKVHLFLRFLHGRKSFDFLSRKTPFPIEKLDPEGHCLLKEMSLPLQWISRRLRQKVMSVQANAEALKMQEGMWEIQTKEGSFFSQKVILATGAEAKHLFYPHLKSISLESALDPSKLAKEVDPQDTIAVFGSSHSAVLILAHLLELRPQKIYNFYLSAHIYAAEKKGEILFDNTGLKGFAANWARKYLDEKHPDILERCLAVGPTFERALAQCTKAIYAIGFERRKLPFLAEGYNETTGAIAPRLFGTGIAYPQKTRDILGRKEYRVGLWKFMDHQNRELPRWL